MNSDRSRGADSMVRNSDLERGAIAPTPGPRVRFHIDARKRGLYGLQPIGSRQFRDPSIAEVVHFETCHAVGAYSAVNVQVPPMVPVWQYVAADERAAAARKCAAIARATHPA